MLCIQEAMIERQKRLLVRFSSEPVAQNPRFAHVVASSPLPSAQSSITFEKLLERFRQTKPLGCSPKTAFKRRAQDRLLLEIIGAKTSIRAVTREHARRVQAILERLRANWPTRCPRAADVLEYETGKLGKPMNPATSGPYLSAFVAVFEFAVNENLLDRSPAKDLRIAGDGIAAKDKKFPFTVEDLQRIFAVEGQGPADRWIPLIGLLSGMRLGEIWPLCESDFAIRDGVDVILLHEEDGRSLKTSAARRAIPVHSELKRLGLLDFVKQHPQGACLFPGVTSSRFSKQFGRLLDKLGIPDREKKGTHSLRHTFKQALIDAEVHLSCVSALMGWRERGMHGVYGGQMKTRVLSDAVERVRFEGLDLSHLL
jgi:integrase